MRLPCPEPVHYRVHLVPEATRAAAKAPIQSQWFHHILSPVDSAIAPRLHMDEHLADTGHLRMQQFLSLLGQLMGLGNGQ